MSARFRRLLSLGALTLLAASCERISVGSEIAGELHRGRDYAAAITARGRDTTITADSTATVVALAYLERQRLGLGSPFLLIDDALNDPRVADSTRRPLAWALLARTLDGAGNDVSPLALDALGVPSAFNAPAGGWAHLRLIEHAVRETDNPRAGELAVRLAYTLATSEHLLRADAPRVATAAAAQIRDRELAQADARDLLRAAWKSGVDPLVLLPHWRTARRFAVEAPLMGTLDRDARLAALRLVPRLLEDIEHLGESEDRGEDTRGEILSERSAIALASVADRADAPPEAPVVVTLAGLGGRLLGSAMLDSGMRAAREQFVSRSRTEESLAAQHALVLWRAPGVRVERATLMAAVALRAYAQATPWFPGDGGPTDRELVQRYGLASVSFDPDFPEPWKPYYRGMLLSALDDLRRVLPSLDVSGLHVQFGESPMGRTALAMHDPRRRVLYLPPATSGGAIAHELAHDVDWQAARRRDAVRGDYATDRAVRDAGQGLLAVSMRGLAAASAGAAAYPESSLPPSRRPTEIFARSMDWLTAASLAHEGRINGYLSSVQDGVLTGYVSVTPPDARGDAGVALVHILDDVSPLAPSLRAWYLSRFGPGRAPEPRELVDRIVEAPLDPVVTDSNASVLRLLEPIRQLRDSLAALVLDSHACDADDSGKRDRLEQAELQLVDLAARARTRGLLRRQGSVVVVDSAYEIVPGTRSDTTPFAHACARPDADQPPFDVTAPAQ